jgi:tRNA A-37 threonylcarbamoyl transferase component Bud32
MAIVQSIATLLLKPLFGDIAEQVVAILTDHWTDYGERLVKALRTANERAWRSLEVALAGDSWWQQVKGLLTRKEDQAFSLQVRAFLDGLPLTDLVGKTSFREQCLSELRQARRNQDLTKGELTAAVLRAEARPLGKAQPQAVLDAQLQALHGIAADLRQSGHKNLAWLVEQRPPSGPPLLTLAVQFFFQRAVESDAGLFQGLTYSTLGELTAAQRVGFQSLNAALSQQGRQLDALLDRLDEIQRQIEELKQLVQDAIKHNQLGQRELRPRDSLSIRSGAERDLVKRLVAQYRNLPEDRQRQLPELLGDLARLQVAAGEFKSAQKHFEEVAQRVADVRLRATACFNAYRAALEQQAWSDALRHLERAVELDEARLAPFPVSRYRPLRILGAGGFGVAFLCEHRHMKVPVVVKAVLQDDLDRAIESVFNEARLLTQLDDPGFVRVWDCGYADPAGKSRPYLVMDFFDGPSLVEHVKLSGCLSPTDAKAVLRPIAQALQSAHAGKILHRDVKPANVLLRRTDTGWRVKLIDFGLALKQSTLQAGADDTARLGRTVSGHGIAGTLDYAAPEQLGKLPGCPLGPHCDVYGFGKTAYFALLGTPDPDDHQRATLPKAWRKFLSECVAHPQTRLPDFAAVLKLLNRIKPPRAPKHEGKAKVPAPVPAVPRAYSVACPHCRKELQSRAEHLGKPARCPHCSGVFLLPKVHTLHDDA